MVKIIKSEVTYLLKNYFEICDEDVNVKIEVGSQNVYEVDINFVSSAIKIAKTF